MMYERPVPEHKYVHYSAGHTRAFWTQSSSDAPMQDPTEKGQVLNRTWTISSHPSEQTSKKAFSISVKQVGLI